MRTVSRTTVPRVAQSRRSAGRGVAVVLFGNGPRCFRQFLSGPESPRGLVRPHADVLTATMMGVKKDQQSFHQMQGLEPTISWMLS